MVLLNLKVKTIIFRSLNAERQATLPMLVGGGKQGKEQHLGILKRLQRCFSSFHIFQETNPFWKKKPLKSHPFVSTERLTLYLYN